MVLNNILNRIKIFFYALLWCLFIIGATFPDLILDLFNFDSKVSFSFLSEENSSMQGIFKNYMFSMVMAFVLLLIDIAYPIMSSEIDTEKMKWGWLTNIISTIAIALCLVFLCSIDCFCIKKFWFIFFWTVLFIYKVIFIQISSNSEKKQKVLYVYRD
jgi:hypothetical protein